jgi:hypothetical protein
VFLSRHQNVGGGGDHNAYRCVNKCKSWECWRTAVADNKDVRVERKNRNAVRGDVLCAVGAEGI